jgi:hypothetical protein
MDWNAWRTLFSGLLWWRVYLSFGKPDSVLTFTSNQSDRLRKANKPLVVKFSVRRCWSYYATMHCKDNIRVFGLFYVIMEAMCSNLVPTGSFKINCFKYCLLLTCPRRLQPHAHQGLVHSLTRVSCFIWLWFCDSLGYSFVLHLAMVQEVNWIIHVNLNMFLEVSLHMFLPTCVCSQVNASKHGISVNMHMWWSTQYCVSSVHVLRCIQFIFIYLCVSLWWSTTSYLSCDGVLKEWLEYSIFCLCCSRGTPTTRHDSSTRNPCFDYAVDKFLSTVCMLKFSASV